MPFWKTCNFRCCCVPLLLVSLLAGLTGCERVDSQFRFSEETELLAPQAEQAVKQTLVANFGSPDDPRIPVFFPVERGQISLTVADFDPEKPTELLIEKPDGEVELVGKRLELLFDPEDAFDVQMEAMEEEQPNPLDGLDQLTIAGYDAETGTITLTQPLPDVELIEPGLELAAAPNSYLAEGERLYAQHCLHCHGVTGDGNGPTAQYMEPKPRDYRQGKFKFTSTGPQDRASDADLAHILREGIPGTYMPSFKMLPEEQISRLVNYVKFLAMRGETEQALNIEVGLDFASKVLEEELEDVTDPEEIQEIKADFNEELDEFILEVYPEIALFGMLDLADAWDAANDEDAIVYPTTARPEPFGPSVADPSRTSVENGRVLYLGKDAQCASCHGDAGRGDGFQTRQLQKRRDGSDYDVPGLHDDWANPLKPRDLTSDIYRGGRRPIDIFRRIHVGIKGTPMPAFGGKSLTDDQIWDIVNFVMTLPHDKGPTTSHPPAEGAVGMVGNE